MCRVRHFSHHALPLPPSLPLTCANVRRIGQPFNGSLLIAADKCNKLIHFLRGGDFASTRHFRRSLLFVVVVVVGGGCSLSSFRWYYWWHKLAIVTVCVSKSSHNQSSVAVLLSLGDRRRLC